MSTTRPIALITGASTGIGATYADRLARRGYDLILVARDQARLGAVATQLRAQTARQVETIPADLTQSDQLARIEARLRDDPAIRLLVNNAGAVQHGGFASADVAELDALVRLNVLALTRLTQAVLPRFLGHEDTAIINIASLVAIAPEVPFGIYAATKAYVLSLSQSLQVELAGRGPYVQAVLPGATRTEIWQRSGRDVSALQGSMDVDELVDAALVGFDRREPVTIPPLAEPELWNSLTRARQALLPGLVQSRAAERYRASSA
jgi:short-subunit dehydrogenase